jgi:hypothetical protein
VKYLFNCTAVAGSRINITGTFGLTKGVDKWHQLFIIKAWIGGRRGWVAFGPENAVIDLAIGWFQPFQNRAKMGVGVIVLSGSEELTNGRWHIQESGAHGSNGSTPSGDFSEIEATI